VRAVAEQSTVRAKPFLKWAGGKGQLLSEIDKRLPKEEIKAGEIDTYIEPFVGGGAVFFYIARKYPQVKRFLLCDINEDLVNCWNAVKEDPERLVRKLRELENDYLALDESGRHKFYYGIRHEFNEKRNPAHLIFLNKTCFNGLYRVNRKNKFNVPFGRYKEPKVCDVENLRAVAHVLQRAELVTCDFRDVGERTETNDRAFFYFDPPYRPLSATASFTSYSRDSFSEQDQKDLAKLCRDINKRSAKFLLSNSDPKNEDPNDHFFEDHYKGFKIETVKANRAINCKASQRGQISELLITNYSYALT